VSQVHCKTFLEPSVNSFNICYPLCHL